MGWSEEPDVTELPNNLWALTSFGKIGQEEPFLMDTEITLQFREDSRVEGMGGCNGYIGTYEASYDGLIAISVLGWTDRACFSPEGVMEQETLYFEALGNVLAFEIQSGRLRLFYNDGESVLNFVSLPTGVRGCTWGEIKALLG